MIKNLLYTFIYIFLFPEKIHVRKIIFFVSGQGNNAFASVCGTVLQKKQLIMNSFQLTPETHKILSHENKCPQNRFRKTNAKYY